MKLVSNFPKIISAKTKKFLWALGMHAFWIVLLFIFLEIIWGSFIFYKYVFLAEREQPQANGSVIRFDYKTYQSVLDELQVKGQ